MAQREDIYEAARAEVEAILDSSPPTEEALVEVIRFVGSRAADDLGPSANTEPDEAEAWEILAAADAWTSLASYAFQRIYNEGEQLEVGTPFLRYRGMSKKVSSETLTSLAQRLRPALQTACRALGAVEYAVGVAFPGGPSISVSWTPK